MNQVDLVVTGGQIVSPERIVSQAIAVDAGKIVRIDAADRMPPARERIDARGLHLLPGALFLFRVSGVGRGQQEAWFVVSSTQSSLLTALRP